VRLLVFPAAFLLLAPSLRRSPAQGVSQDLAGQDVVAPLGNPGDCIHAITTTANCPSGCTTATFTQWIAQPGTNGVDYLEIYPYPPCGTAKPGQQCSQPTWWNPVNDREDCCAVLGAYCTNDTTGYLNCCDQYAVCGAKHYCCYPNRIECSSDDECCSGHCDPIRGCC